MPELPEVETIVRALRPLVTGLTIKELHLYHPRVYRYNSPGLLKSSVSGRRIDTITRLGKYILFRFVEGSRPAMVVHLRMTGQLLFTRQSPETNYVRAALEFTDSNWLLFRDVRTFGALFLEGDDAPPGFRNLGVEPLSKSFQTELLRKILNAGVFRSNHCFCARSLLRESVISMHPKFSSMPEFIRRENRIPWKVRRLNVCIWRCSVSCTPRSTRWVRLFPTFENRMASRGILRMNCWFMENRELPAEIVIH